MAIYRPHVFPPSMIKSPLKHPGFLLALVLVLAVIFFPIFLNVVKAAIGNWKELSSLAFYEAVVAPAAIWVLATFGSVCVISILFYISECFTARLYERFGRAHVLLDPKSNTFPDLLKACWVLVPYAVGGIAVAIPVIQHAEGFLEFFRQIWPRCTEPFDECMIADAYRMTATVVAADFVTSLGAMSLGAVIRLAEFLVLFMLTQNCAHKHEGQSQAIENKTVIRV